MAKNKKKLKLVLPDKKYYASFKKGMAEARQENSLQFRSTFNLLDATETFAEYAERLKKERLGINLKKGRVPQTLFWAVVGGKFIGILKLRHYLNKALQKEGGHIGYAVIPSERRKGYATEMLRLGLQKAHKLKIKKVLLTCLADNIASSKVIEKNGGEFANKVEVSRGILKRFWIK